MSTLEPRRRNGDIEDTSKRKKRSANLPPTGPARFADASTTQTLADTIYQHLYRDITSMRLLPGTPISEQDIANARGVSRTPVREAILRLARERLVEVVPKSGSYVGRIPLSSLPESMVARSALEAITVKAATERATPSQLLSLKVLLEQQREAIAAKEIDVFFHADESFHATIAEIASYPGIWHIIQQLKIQVDRYRWLTVSLETIMEQALLDHTAILETMESKDADAAVKHMNIHMERLKLRMASDWDQYANYFIQDIDSSNFLQD